MTSKAEQKLFYGYSKLIKDDSFWGVVGRNVLKVPTDRVPTAGVTFVDNGFRMYYNPDFINALSPKQVVGILKHEFMHIVFDHLKHFKEEGKEQVLNRIWNVAQDLAINSYIPKDQLPDIGVFSDDIDHSKFPDGELPVGGCYPGEGKFEDMPKYKSSYWYFNKMMKDQEKYMDVRTIDIHISMNGEEDAPEDVKRQREEWSQMNEDFKERVKKKILERAYRQTKSDQWGNVPEEIQRRVKEKLSRRVSWNKVLRHFVKSRATTSTRSSIKKINRRYPWKHPGRKRIYDSKIAVSVDQSGSMSDEMIAEISGELNHLCEFVEFTVICFDTQVRESHKFIWSKNEKQSLDRFASGGTDLGAPIKWVDKQKEFNGHIMFSDMGASKPDRPKTDTIFVNTAANDPGFDPPGKLIRLE